MAFKIYKQGSEKDRLTSFILDSVSDVSSLPVQPEVAAGSTALVAENSAVFILTPSDQWVEL